MQPEEEGRIRPFDIAELLEESVFGPRREASRLRARQSESE
jgi:hypothetical protein